MGRWETFLCDEQELLNADRLTEVPVYDVHGAAWSVFGSRDSLKCYDRPLVSTSNNE